MFEGIKNYYQENKKWGPLTFFLAGFFFDIFTLGQMDDLFTNLQLGLYLLLAGFLIYLEVLVFNGDWIPNRFWQKIWRFHLEITQFILGGLMSVYTLFYFQSSSIFSSFAFIFVLAMVMLINEFVDFGTKGMGARVLFYSFCMVSFFIYLVPVIFGAIGPFYFMFSLIVSTTVYYLYYQPIKKRLLEKHPSMLFRAFRMPFMAVILFFTLAYYSKVIPPVPLSLSYIGIFHKVEKSESGYELKYERSFWRFWEKGAQTFIAAPGERVYSFFSIFPTTDFKDRVFVRWKFKNAQGNWEGSDAIPIAIFGGRREGYRGYTFKENFQEGDWRIQVETEDERELGRIYFTITKDDSLKSENREWKTLTL